MLQKKNETRKNSLQKKFTRSLQETLTRHLQHATPFVSKRGRRQKKGEREEKSMEREISSSPRENSLGK